MGQDLQCLSFKSMRFAAKLDISPWVTGENPRKIQWQLKFLASYDAVCLGK